MIPWELLSTTKSPDKKSELTLLKRDTEYSIRINGLELMNSRMYGSEEVLAELPCKAIAGRKDICVLIGGLGMGYTLSAALKNLNAESKVIVSEFFPSVVQWNREILGKLAGFPIDDSRVSVLVEDVVKVIKDANSKFDAILLDVDNGPDGLTREDNNRLYSIAGLNKIKNALKPGGVVSIWSASEDNRFTKKLKKPFSRVTEKKVRARANKKGPLHTIWLAKR